MKTKLLLISLLCIGLLSCEKDNKIENDKNSSNNQENVNGKGDKNTPSYIKNGALPGGFSVSDTKKVKFSQGNLQYQASTNTWRFAENQYDYVGIGNQNISNTYSGWIDLFGWGTGDNPTNASEYYKNYSTFVDWGVNKISNGGNVANAWFTLSDDEWNYLLRNRANAKKYQGVACVNGINGLVLLPDGCVLPSDVHFTSGFASNRGSEYYKTVNTYTILEWQIMESGGAVFLPAAGNRNGTSVSSVGYFGTYWSSTESHTYYASCMNFVSDDAGMNTYGTGEEGQSVRLCSEFNY